MSAERFVEAPAMAGDNRHALVGEMGQNGVGKHGDGAGVEPGRRFVEQPQRRPDRRVLTDRQARQGKPAPLARR